MPPIDSARQIAAQRVGPLQPVARLAGARAQAAGTPVEAAPVAVIASIAAELSAAGEPPVDMDRVATIRAAISRGEYSLEPGEIADALIAAGHLTRDSE
ncbi:flagellar biosynthesis anti-sigma factor FlgM [Croceibacterium sp. TMG7-5b_MA50]|uniref:flagellar biosynthesis anti-sigma factor FlgM n=1 Tax=Croceibacterium sp. TMG7-5b_MA50 TaxID=3121290 RepID=UPI003221B553